jgi:hypothetical protein
MKELPLSFESFQGHYLKDKLSGFPKDNQLIIEYNFYFSYPIILLIISISNSAQKPPGKNFVSP